MNLIDDMTEDYTILDKTTVDDLIGGYSTKYVDGAKIQGAMTFDTSLQARVAGAQGVSSVYTFTTKKNVILQFHDVLRRESDKKIFRVTSDGDDKYTPSSARLNMRQVNCEEWTIPPDELPEE